MRILVTGATGFIGSALVGAARARGDVVTTISRREGPGWDAIPSEIERVEAIVHLAGEPIAAGRWTHERLERIRESRVQATGAIARAIETAARKPRVLVSGSAVGIYGMRSDDEMCDENTAPGDDVLARIAVAWEAAADPARRAGVRVVHARTGIVLGKGGGALARMAPPFHWFLGGPIGGGRQWLSWIQLRDEVRALLFALDKDFVTGAVNLVAPEPVRMDVFAAVLGRTLNRPARLRVPGFALRLALGEGLADVLLTGQRVQPRRLVDAGFGFEFPALKEAIAESLRPRAAP
jgi:uncharacterized protein (TIGR01777 family)